MKQSKQLMVSLKSCGSHDLKNFYFLKLSQIPSEQVGEAILKRYETLQNFGLNFINLFYFLNSEQKCQ
jgi:hypothetical protein